MYLSTGKEVPGSIPDLSVGHVTSKKLLHDTYELEVSVFYVHLLSYALV